MPEVPKEGAHYITLKEAAKISGYSPDYLGQLIRKGKLAGKQVYLNVAWVTTEQALKDYLDNNKVTSGKGDFSTNLRGKLRRWWIAHSSGDEIIKLARRVIYLVIVALVLFCLFLVYAFFANINHASAAVGVPRILSYQGRLLDSSGNLLGGAGTAYCFRFSLWNASSGGSQVWPAATASIMTATVTNGVFNIGVGDTSAGGDALTYDFQSSDSVFLNVQVATKVDPLCTGGSEVFETLNPRERVVASGYAINSYSVDGYSASTNASGTEIPVIASDTLTLAGVDPQINATGTNTLTLQGGNGTGAIQFFSTANFINSAGAFTVASTVTGNMIQATATSSQFLFDGNGGVVGSLSWTPTVEGVLTIPNFATASDTIELMNFAQALNNKTLNTSTLNSPIINTSTENSPTLYSPTVFAGMSLIQNVATTGLMLAENSTGTAFSVLDMPTSTQSSSAVLVSNSINETGAEFVVANYGSGNAFQVNDSSSPVFFITGNGRTVTAPSTNTSSAFAVENASQTATLFQVDTLNNLVKIGNNSAAGSVPTLLRLDEKSDAGDPTGFPGAMYYSSSTGEFRCYQAGVWYNCVPTSMNWQQSFLSNRWGDWAPQGDNATTLTNTNLVAAVPSGAAAVSGQAEDYYIQWTSAGVTADSAGASSSFAETEPRYTPRATTRIRTDTAITNRRIWFALNSANLSASNGTGTLATVYFGIVYSTTSSSTDWQCGSGDGVTGSTIDTGVPVTVSTYYDMILDASVLGQLTCRIATNGGAYVSVTKSDHIPTSTTLLGITNLATQLSATAVVHRIAYVYLGGGN